MAFLRISCFKLTWIILFEPFYSILPILYSYFMITVLWYCCYGHHYYIFYYYYYYYYHYCVLNFNAFNSKCNLVYNYNSFLCSYQMLLYFSFNIWHVHLIKTVSEMNIAQNWQKRLIHWDSFHVFSGSFVQSFNLFLWLSSLEVTFLYFALGS